MWKGKQTMTPRVVNGHYSTTLLGHRGGRISIGCGLLVKFVASWMNVDAAQLTSRPHFWHFLPGMTQTTCPRARQSGHRFPGTCEQSQQVLETVKHWSHHTGIVRIGSESVNDGSSSSSYSRSWAEHSTASRCSIPRPNRMACCSGLYDIFDVGAPWVDWLIGCRGMVLCFCRVRIEDVDAGVYGCGKDRSLLRVVSSHAAEESLYPTHRSE